jgi:hypothetical protein
VIATGFVLLLLGVWLIVRTARGGLAEKILGA